MSKTFERFLSMILVVFMMFTMLPSTMLAEEGVHEHVFTTTVTDATCTENGSETQSCACGTTIVNTIEAKGHSYTASVTKEATCTEAGEKSFTCSVCGDVQTEAIPAAGHTYEVVETAATCTAEGSKVSTCSVCGDV